VNNRPLSDENTIRAACIDSGRKVAFMDWNDGELTLVISADKKPTLCPKGANPLKED